MKPQIPWLRVFVEGVVIVGSILLAFGIQAWWDEAQERAEEQEILMGLETDFAANLAQLRGVVSVHDWAQDMVARLEAMSDADLAAVPPDSVGLYARAMGASRSFDARDGTLDAVMASGTLSVIADPRLRDLLVEWKGRVEDAGEEARDLRAVSQRVAERNAQLGGPWRLTFDEAAPLEGVSGNAAARLAAVSEAMGRYPPANLAALAKDTDLMGLVRWKVYAGRWYLLELRPLAEHADSVLALVQANRR